MVGKNIILLASASLVAFKTCYAFVASPEQAIIGRANLVKYKDFMPSFNVVEAGGWYATSNLAADPKSSMFSLLKEKVIDDSKLDAVISMLQAKNKGFSSEIVEGDWSLAYQMNSKKSPALQKILSKQGKAPTRALAQANFVTENMKFVNLRKGKRSTLTATVKYNPVGDGFTMSPENNVVIRRIMCDIVDATFKYSFLPRVPLPIRAKGGHLDFLYLDNDVRITKGNRGGIFVHVRPDILESMKA
mmetsp:Transcript_39169/g.76456  ORF Transcript_39169/g.76456 Transcript_39169/m.76456 type:complete len:246 (+) Transcript_39169:83-820(+)